MLVEVSMTIHAHQLGVIDAWLPTAGDHTFCWVGTLHKIAIVAWLEEQAIWKGKHYTDSDIPREFGPEWFEPAGRSDLHLLLSLRS